MHDICASEAVVRIDLNRATPREQIRRPDGSWIDAERNADADRNGRAPAAELDADGCL